MRTSKHFDRNIITWNSLLNFKVVVADTLTEFNYLKALKKQKNFSTGEQTTAQAIFNEK